MTNSKASFKQRFIMTGSVLALIILLFVFYAYQLVTQTAQDNITSSQFSQSLNQIVDVFTDQLQRTEREVYEMAVMPDKELHKALQGHIDELLIHSNELTKLLASDNAFQNNITRQQAQFHADFKVISLQLNQQIRSIKPFVAEFCENAIDVEKRFPGMPLLLSELLPRNNQYIESVDLAIIETRQSDRNDINNKRVLELFRDARYYWSQQANWLRLFVANRYGVFGESQKSMQHSLQNRNVYMGEVYRVLAELKKLYENDQLELQQSLSYEEMVELIADYEKFFIQTRDIYLSENWRNDLVIFRDEVRPGLNKTWELVYQLQDKLKSYNQFSISQSQAAAQTVTNFILVVALIIILTFILGYFVFDKFIRKPITNIADALNQEADQAGTGTATLAASYVRETDILNTAFQNMQKQVHSRQTRLESILDSAAEGIITIDQNGIIETFNIAAQRLFGYSEEVIGQNVSMLLPKASRAKHSVYMQDMMSGKLPSIAGQAREMEAVDSNGKNFPISIKLSEMELDGRQHFTAVVENISQRKALIENLQKLAEHDSLTGLYNRHYFTEEVDKIVKRYNRGDENHIALLYIDLDNFKYVNDTMGHLAGDQLIVEAGSLLKSRTRESDIIARLGGDEFAVLLYQPDVMYLENIANSFRQLFEEYTFMHSGKVVDIGCSIGAAVPDKQTKTVEHLLARADFACHEAKRHGRNQVYVYQSSDNDSMNLMNNDIGWAYKIKQALEENRFVLALQPINSIANTDEAYYEVLIRMLDENNEIIMPAGFIPAAERFGLMTQIDTWVITHAIDYVKHQHDNANKINVSINLSASSVEDPGIIELIQGRISSSGIPAGSIMLELTETTAIDNLNVASIRLRQLQELGCKTALDDFGIGYSSFAYLKDLPIDVVKIDGSFVKDIHEDTLHKAMVRSINEIAHEMGKLTVAEFVENEKILNILSALGVDYAQGYHLGKPEIIQLPEDDTSSHDIKIA